MMKVKFLTFVLSIFSIALTTAQDGKMTAQEMADYQQDLMVKELNLSAEQEKALVPINLKFAKKQKELMEREGSMFGKIGDFKRLKREKNTELEAVLTEEQMEKYEDDVAPQIKKFMRKQM